jgi:threonine synthase
MENLVGGGNLALPEKLSAFMKGERKSHPLNVEYEKFKEFLLR